MKKIIPGIILLHMLVIFSMMDAYGQNVVRGRITEKDTKEPLIGATVVELDANDRIVKGAIADVNGNYVINVSSSGARLQYSFIGFQNIIVEVKGRNVIDIELTSSAIQFGEVVVTATRETDPLTGQNIRDRTVAATRINMAELRNVGGLSVDEALQGQISGLDIVSGGAPGSGSSIVIRGLGSLGDAQPLIVVNGIAQDIATNFSFEGADQEDIGALLSIAPQDIKSIDLLKDAAATAIWGSRGANGVLLIETERGARGKTLFNYNYRFTLTQQPDPIPMLNGDEYITLQLEQYHNALGLFVTPNEIAYDPEFTDFYNYSANTDWLGEITRTGMNHEHFFKFSGGGDKTAFYASLNATQQDGTTLNEAFKRLSTRINLDYDLSRKIKFSVNFTYNNSYRNGNLSLGGRNVRQMAYIKAPNMSIMEHDEFGNLTGEFFNPINSYQGSGISFFNPVAIASQSRNDVQDNTFQNSYVFNYAINKWIRLIETISFQYANVKNIGFLPHTAIGADWLHNSNNQSNERNPIT
jgi:TonB-dependent SusC/RagA subfamily outer membrane receptor